MSYHRRETGQPVPDDEFIIIDDDDDNNVEPMEIDEVDTNNNNNNQYTTTTTNATTTMIDNFDTIRNTYVVDNNNMDIAMDQSQGFDVASSTVDNNLLHGHNSNQGNGNQIDNVLANNNTDDLEAEKEISEMFRQGINDYISSQFTGFDFADVDMDKFFAPWDNDDNEMNFDIEKIFAPWM
ncbi:unnamed protein product [Rotaria sordida]|uniref:Uncharacterized protein n=1 Tax=Rotaria sordida TaxID=392033 RepID=A0A815UWX5_9BILA|nr:unnamed protein product [Rotaria sordida]CAF1524676.1 unnamed protein product [Rotaria sordida]